MRGREDNDLVQLRHVCQESYAEGPNLVDHTPMLEVHEGLIEVQHERVSAVLGVSLVEGRREQRLPIHDVVGSILLGLTIGVLPALKASRNALGFLYVGRR